MLKDLSKYFLSLMGSYRVALLPVSLDTSQNYENTNLNCGVPVYSPAFTGTH